MCGRFVSSNTPDRIASYFGASFDDASLDGASLDGASFDGTSLDGNATADGEPDRAAGPNDARTEPPTAIHPLGANYNVAPTNDIYAVVADSNAEPTLRTFRWGLVPSWAKDLKIGSKMINARAETLAEKPAFKSLFRSKRVIVPMDGFYEWKVVPGHKTKQPYFIHRCDDEPLAVAGLWAVWRDKAAGPDAPWLHTCTVITTAANATMAPVHDRMPVLLAPQAWQQWLDPDNHDLRTAIAAKLAVTAANVTVGEGIASPGNR